MQEQASLSSSTSPRLLYSPVPDYSQDDILLLSQLKPCTPTEEGQSTLIAKVTSTMVVIGEEYVKFSFDLRFGVNQEELTFYVGQEEYTYVLTNNDHLKWRQCLKMHINQRGFHEQFKAIKKIGQGSFASVYLVKRIQTGEQFAVKAFSKQSAYSQDNGKQCLIKEIQIMRLLKSKHNMKLIQVFESDNSLYLVFELLQGGMLYEKIKTKKLYKPKQVRQMVFGILQGLREMHSKGIMHRDLKPENILLRTDAECVIADFGLAEFVDEEIYLFTRCGTPGYVAPEVINITDMTTKYSSVCDVFSLGLIFHTLLFGKSVFTGKTYNEVLKENRQCNFKLQGEQYSKLPHQTLDLLKKMLRSNPEQRITSEQAVAHPYFKQLEQQSEEQDHKVDQLQQSGQKFNKNGQSNKESPILTTANVKRKQNKDLKKDSCIGLKIGKDSIFTGKTDTIGTLSSQKVSGFGGQLIKGLVSPKKKSKFSQQKPNQFKEQDKENAGPIS